MILQNLNINTGPLLASAGFVGLAVGVGAQSLIKDFIAGVFIITENQYRLGDLVEIQGVTGTVEAITVRTTILRDSNGAIHHIPNGSITSTANKSMGYGLINLDIAVDSETDLSKAEAAINKIGDDLSANPKYEKLITEKPHYGHIADFGAARVIIKVLGKTVSGAETDIKSAFFEAFKKACQEEGIKLTKITKTDTKKTA